MAFGFGIVGCGMIANFHARAIGDIRGAKVVACFDTIPASADRFAKSDRVHKPANLQKWGAEPTGHGFQGGDLLGIAEHLDYLVDLGVTAIYLNPIFISGANHRYHCDDFYQVDPLLGGNEALDEMIAACHDRDIRVVLDGVFNHVGRGFHQFHNIVENGEESPYLDWFTIDKLPLNPYGKGPAGYLGWYNLKPLPRLDTDNPVVREYVMKVAEHWLRKGIDGWRLDVPVEVTADGFWEEFRERVREINPDAYIVGEIWEDSSEYIVGGTRFDATMNYLLTVEVLSFAAGERIDPAHVVPNPAYASVAPIDAPTYAERIDTLFARYPMETADEQRKGALQQEASRKSHFERFPTFSSQLKFES